MSLYLGVAEAVDLHASGRAWFRKKLFEITYTRLSQFADVIIRLKCWHVNVCDATWREDVAELLQVRNHERRDSVLQRYECDDHIDRGTAHAIEHVWTGKQKRRCVALWQVCQ